jgi:hypothetical protein
MLPNQIGALPALQPTQESHGRRRVPDHHCRANSTSMSVDSNRRADSVDEVDYFYSELMCLSW